MSIIRNRKSSTPSADDCSSPVPSGRSQLKRTPVLDQVLTAQSIYDKVHLQHANSHLRNHADVVEVLQRTTNVALTNDLNALTKKFHKICEELDEKKAAETELRDENSKVKAEMAKLISDNQALNISLINLTCNQTNADATILENPSDLAQVQTWHIERSQLALLRDEVCRSSEIIQISQRKMEQMEARYSEKEQASKDMIKILEMEVASKMREVEEAEHQINCKIDHNKTISAEKINLILKQQELEEQLSERNKKIAEADEASEARLINYQREMEEYEYIVCRMKATEKSISQKLASWQRKYKNEKKLRAITMEKLKDKSQLVKTEKIKTKVLERKQWKLQNVNNELERELAASRQQLRAYADESEKGHGCFTWMGKVFS